MARIMILVAAVAAALTVGLSTQATGQTPAQCPPGANQNPAFCNTPCPPGTTNTNYCQSPCPPGVNRPDYCENPPVHRPEPDARR